MGVKMRVSPCDASHFQNMNQDIFQINRARSFTRKAHRRSRRDTHDALDSYQRERDFKLVRQNNVEHINNLSRVGKKQ